jgi:hypothetical protein
MLICHYDARGARAVVTLITSKSAEALAIGQKFPARIIMAEHSPMHQRASIVATLLTCDQTAAVVRLEGTLDKEAGPELAPLLERVEEELARRPSLDRARVWFHERLLYAFQNDDTKNDTNIEAWPGGAVWEGPAGIEAATTAPTATAPTAKSIIAIVRRVVGGDTVDVSGIWSRTLDLYRSSPLVRHVAAGPPPAGWGEPADSVARAVFAEYLKNVLDFLVCVREMTELYNTPELEKNNANLWAVMRAAQKRA